MSVSTCLLGRMLALVEFQCFCVSLAEFWTALWERGEPKPWSVFVGLFCVSVSASILGQISMFLHDSG